MLRENNRQISSNSELKNILEDQYFTNDGVFEQADIEHIQFINVIQIKPENKDLHLRGVKSTLEEESGENITWSIDNGTIVGEVE